ncbi:solute carrier family 25, member 33/36 [Strigomonas culicis]|uniref:Solute carrier family 25, member 33/36 n=1 Tax=Strigomonas culicis TaxID=28005 RepID=S9W097_9TRYP|nr:solute carrier family 25, member 33/36 [Strigomonas culicis]|eukprot:EPY29360.1 solute carrier family 25, member 33/36 [Strigomonas culicis]
MSVSVSTSPGYAKNDNRSNVASVFAGGLAGVCSTCVINPLDTVRVRLSAGRHATGQAQNTLLQTIRELTQEGLWHAFSRGLGANILASMPSNAVYLPTYRFLKNTLEPYSSGHRHRAPGAGPQPLAVIPEAVLPLCCAFGAVATTNLTLAPLFVVRTRVQVDDKLTIREVAAQVYRREGARGFYRGTVTNVCGRIVEEGLFWSIFELLRRTTEEGSFAAAPRRPAGGTDLTTNAGSSTSTMKSFWWTSMAMVGLTMFSKLTATSIAYPYNVVMNHLRTVNKHTGQHDFTRVGPTVRHIYRQDGIFGFYKGLSPQLLRSVLSKATQIYSFELAMFMYAQMAERRYERLHQ